MAFFDFIKKKELNRIKELEQALQRYDPVMSVEDAIAEKQKAAQSRLAELKNDELRHKEEIAGLQKKIKATSDQYSSAHDLYNRLQKEVQLFESKLDLIEFGIYEPVYDFERSDEYRAKAGKNHSTTENSYPRRHCCAL